MANSNDFDFNSAAAGSGNFDLIPVNTIAPMLMTIRPGAHGDGGWLTKSKTSDAEYLNVEFAITSGPFRGRKIWQNFTVSGGKVDESGNSKAAGITRSTLRGILESSKGIRSDDESEAAKSARMVKGYGDFSGLEFIGKIGIEKGSGGYADKNKLLAPVGPESREYKQDGGATAPNPAFTPAIKPAAGAVPAWAQ